MAAGAPLIPVLDAPGLTCGWVAGRFRFPGHSLTLIAKGSFDLHPDAAATPAEVPEDLTGDLPFEGAPEGSPRYDSDFAYYKPRADVMVVGACHPPGGRAVRSDVGFRVGSLTKRLRVVGDRRWLLPFGPLSPRSRPEPFERLPLRYERAAGGGRSRRNPVGVGRRRTRDEAGRLIRPVPNLERPGRAVLSPWWQGPPVGFGPLARTWRPRTRKLGSYRRRWRKTRFPWLPEDFDWAHYNAAPVDQRVPYLRGDEPIELSNLHPAHASYRSELPGWRMRCFLDVPEPGDEAPRLREVPLVLDTLWIDAEQERLVLVWRGLADVASPEFEEVAHAFFFHERLDEPRSDAAAVVERFARARAVALGEALPVDEPSRRDPEALRAELLAAQRQKIAEMDAAFGDALEAGGFARDWLDEPTPPFEERVAAAIAQVKEHFGERVADVTFPTADALRAQEAALLAGLGITFPELERPEAMTREAVERRAAAGESLAGEDLRGLDLSGLALASADLVDANLQGASLRGADLGGALLERARLCGADLGEAVLVSARLGSADLSAATLVRADLSNAILDDALLERADLSAALLRAVSAQRADFIEAQLGGADFSGARLEGADLSRARLDATRFAGATLDAVTLEGAAGEGVVFDEARLVGLRAGAGCRLPASSFERVRGADSTWERADLRGARFAGAALDRADFSDADLSDADLTRCVLREARFDRALLCRAQLVQADVFRGSLERADLEEADLRGANLYEVETLEAALRGANLRGANLRMTKLA